MLATRTAKGDCQIALAFMNVMGQQIHEQLGDALELGLVLADGDGLPSSSGAAGPLKLIR